MAIVTTAHIITYKYFKSPSKLPPDMVAKKIIGRR